MKRVSQSTADASVRYCERQRARAVIELAQLLPARRPTRISGSRPTGWSPNAGARSRAVTSACRRRRGVPSGVIASASTSGRAHGQDAIGDRRAGATVGGVAFGPQARRPAARASPPPAATQAQHRRDGQHADTIGRRRRPRRSRRTQPRAGARPRRAMPVLRPARRQRPPADDVVQERTLRAGVRLPSAGNPASLALRRRRTRPPCGYFRTHASKSSAGNA